MTKTFSIDEGLESVGFGRFQLILLILSGIGFCATTVELISITLLRGPLLATWPAIKNEKFAYLMSSTFAGELVGGLTWGMLSDRFGRRLIFICTAFMAAVFGLLGSVAPCFYTFSIIRFCLGFAIGGSLAIDFVYFVEFVPAKARGFRTTFIVLLGICAFFYTSLVGWLALPNWRRFVFYCGLPYAALFVGRLFRTWESPRFLLTKGRNDEAMRVLKAMAIKNGTNLPDGILEPLKATLMKSSSSTTGIASIVSAGMIMPTITTGLLFFFQTFAYYGLIIWLRNFASSRGIQNLDPILAFLVIGLSELPGLAFTTLLIDRIGRKPVLLINFLGSAFCTAALLLVNSRGGFLAISSASYFFIVGCWAAIYISTPEIFPTSCRASAFAVAGAFGKLAGIFSPLLFGKLWDQNVSPSIVVAIVSGSFIIAAIAAAFLMIETRGKVLSDH